MSNNALSDSEKDQRPDNPQETLKVENFYYPGFFAAEMSCSVIKAANYNPVGHYYYAIDFTVSNADTHLLQDINTVVMQGSGVISPIKGAYNLSARGKRRVQIVLDFLSRYPIIVGDLAKHRIALLKEAQLYLETHRGASSHEAKVKVMDSIRKKLRVVKVTASAPIAYRIENVHRNAIGHFLAGVLDGEGSFGFKKSNGRLQPFFAVAMKDRKIIELFQKFLQQGKVWRRKDGMYHYELNRPEVIKKVSTLFLMRYPLRHQRQRRRMENLQWILNDYTRNSIDTSLMHR